MHEIYFICLFCSNDNELMETNSSIKSYDGSTENISIEELAHHELGETKEVRNDLYIKFNCLFL